MRKSYAMPLLAAGAAVLAWPVTPAAVGAPLVAPIPATYPWCELDLFCYDDDIDIALNPRKVREDTEHGGGAAFGSEDDDY